MRTALSGLIAIGLLASTPALAQGQASIELEIHNNSESRKAFLTLTTTNVTGASFVLHGLDPGSNMRERFDFDEHASSGSMKVLLQVFGIDMALQGECTYTLTLQKPLGGTTERTERMAGTICSTMFFVAHPARLDAIIHFKP